MKMRSNFPFQDLIGWTVVSMSDGLAELELDLREDHLSPIGLTHGGVTFSLLDTAMGAAVTASLQRGEYPTTIEMSVRYHRGVSEGKLVAKAETFSRTGRVVHCRASASLDGAEVATATSSFVISRFNASPSS